MRYRDRIDAGQQLAAGKGTCGIFNQFADVLRPSPQTHQAEFAAHAAGNEIRSARVTDVV